MLSGGRDIVPIPGTKRVRYLEENAAAAEIEMTAENLKWIEAAVPRGVTSGERHLEMHLIGP